MKFDLLPFDEFADINHLKEVTSPVLFQRGELPHPDGLVSNEIFGVTMNDRKNTFTYIDLHAHFLHPHIYKVMKRFFRNIDKIISGTENYIIDKEGHLIQDDLGETGLEWLYNNWEKVKWDYSDSSARNERVDLVTKSKKSEVFITKQIVIPPFYRDISSSRGGGGSTQDINNMYVQIIRMSTLLRDRDIFGMSFYSTMYSMQQTIEEIYNYFKLKLEKKNGMIRKYLMGKNVDNCTRTVITAATYHANSPDELFIDYSHAGIPISQVCSLAYPFVANYVKRFFEREFIDNKEQKEAFDKSGKKIGFVELKNPEAYFSDKYIQKKIDQFIKDPETRFEPIEVPLTDGRIVYPVLKGRIFSSASKDELSSIVSRKMTWTDILYIACVEATKDKHSIITRYPVSDKYGVFISRIRVVSTRTTVPVIIGSTVYKFYPVVDPDLSPSKVPNRFIDSTQFSHSYLKGIGGDLTIRQGHHVKLNLSNCGELSLGSNY